MSVARRSSIDRCLRWLRCLHLLALLGTAAAAVSAQAQAAAPASANASAPPAAAPAAAAAAPEVRFTFSDATLRLASAQTKGTVQLTITAEAVGKDPLPGDRIKVEDLAAPNTAGAPAVKFDVVAEHQGGGKGRTWFLNAQAEALPVNSPALTRNALVTLGSFQRTLPYVLTNRPANPPDFSVTQPALWLQRQDEVAAALLLAAGEQPLQGLRLAHAALIDKSQQGSIPLQALELCTLPSGPCVAPPSIPALSAQTVYLRFKAGERPLGRYTGTVALAVEARAETKPVSIEIASTSVPAQLGGAALIVLGVALAWLITLWGRGRVQRLAALQPLAAARERILRLLSALDPVRDSTGVGFESTRRQFEDLVQDSLGEGVLEAKGLLPRAWSLASATPDTAALQAHLKLLEPLIAGLAVVVNEGALVLLERWNAGPDPDRRDLIRTALNTLDAPREARTEEAAVALVKRALEAAEPPQVQRQMSLGLPAARPPLSVRRIGAEIEILNRATWAAYLLLTSVAGIATLILANPGFGTHLDFVYCLFWGFGMPVTLEKLQQLSPAQVGKPLGITLPG